MKLLVLKGARDPWQPLTSNPQSTNEKLSNQIPATKKLRNDNSAALSSPFLPYCRKYDPSYVTKTQTNTSSNQCTVLQSLLLFKTRFHDPGSVIQHLSFRQLYMSDPMLVLSPQVWRLGRSEKVDGLKWLNLETRSSCLHQHFLVYRKRALQAQNYAPMMVVAQDSIL